MIKHNNQDDETNDVDVQETGTIKVAGKEAVSKISETASSESNEEVEIDEDEDNLILKFDKPYKFEGNEYKEVDLSGFEDVTADLLCGLERNFSKKGISSVQPEVSISYAVMLAAEVCELPIEFFNKLPGKEAIKLKNMVVNFFYA